MGEWLFLNKAVETEVSVSFRAPACRAARMFPTVSVPEEDVAPLQSVQVVPPQTLKRFAPERELLPGLCEEPDDGLPSL